jgi:hypothetical protein
MKSLLSSTSLVTVFTISLDGLNTHAFMEPQSSETLLRLLLRCLRTGVGPRHN